MAASEEVTKHSYHTLVFRSIKRSHDMFLADNQLPVPFDEKAKKLLLMTKLRDEYPHLFNNKDKKGHFSGTSEQSQLLAILPNEKSAATDPQDDVVILGAHNFPSAPGVKLSDDTKAQQTGPSAAGINRIMTSLPPSKAVIESKKTAHGIREITEKAMSSGGFERIAPSRAVAQSGKSKTPFSQGLVPRKAPSMPKPQWHCPWKLTKVISGHTGWVRCVAVEPANQWFCTGSADRTIKIWDLASGKLKLSLTGHISTVRGLCVSPRHPYLFSVGEDKQVKCWDLEYNKVIRHYHGHLSAIYCVSLHPTIDVLLTAGRDSTARVWDIRTKSNIHTLVGHSNTIADVQTQSADPQIITGSHDCTVRLWDLAAGKSKITLTNHKKSIRSLALHPNQYTMASASADNIKQWKFPDGNFMQNLSGHNAILNCLAVNADNVLVSGADNGSMYFWDWKTGHNFQRMQVAAQPGSLESESGIFSMTFDNSGSRLITTEADKTIKIYKEDENADIYTLWQQDLLVSYRDPTLETIIIKPSLVHISIQQRSHTFDAPSPAIPTVSRTYASNIYPIRSSKSRSSQLKSNQPRIDEEVKRNFRWFILILIIFMTVIPVILVIIVLT